MMSSRKIRATLIGEMLEGSVAKDRLHSGILLPLIVIEGLDGNGCYTLGYALS